MPYKDKNDSRIKQSRKRWYDENRTSEIQNAKKRVIDARLRNKQYILDFKENKSCVDCGKSYKSYNMHFDHLGDKDDDVCRLAHKPVGLKRLQAEIDKCELVCALCHGDRTEQRRQMSVADRDAAVSNTVPSAMEVRILPLMP